ncbi:DNA internalization-related competence protein ComEC/Rec2 [Lysobacter lycopersici]
MNARWQPLPFGPATALALLAGCVVSLLLPAFAPTWFALLAIALGIAGWWTGGIARIAGTLLLGFGLCTLQADRALVAQLPPAMEGHVVEITGRVVELPMREPKRTRFRFVVDGDSDVALRGKTLQLAWYDDRKQSHDGIVPPAPVHAGERWSFDAKLRAPRGLRNPGGFDAERNALAQGIAATGYVADADNAKRIGIARGLDAWRERMSARIARQAPKDSARFLRAFALGDTGGLQDEDWETLRADGLTHLIAISGFHVGLVAGFGALLARGLWWLFPLLARRCPRQVACGVAALAFAAGYSVIAGLSLPTLRTLLMIAVVVLARILRRATRAGDALALAAIAMLLADALSPLSPGFWLSFLGVAWLLWCLPGVETKPIRGFFAAQGVATLGLLPLTALFFGQASLAGPFANLLAVPWWSLIVAPLTLVGAGLEALHPGAGTWAWWLAGHAFECSWRLFAWMSASPMALWWAPEARWFAVPLALASAFWLLLPRGVPGKPLAILLWLPLLLPALHAPAYGDGELTVIDVGQGLSVLVRTRHHVLLYDMGPAVPDGFDAGERVVVPTLHALGAQRIDVAMVSHGDNDHAGGFPAVERAFPTPLSLSPAGSPVPHTRPCLAGTHWNWDGVEFRVLHPAAGFPYLDNESSCVLRVESKHGAALLTGDIGEVIERKLLREQQAMLRADVVLVAHHGSGGSSDPGFVAATGAKLALVSSGFGNRFHHPLPDVVERWQGAGAKTADTQDLGALRIRLRQGGPELESERIAHPRAWDAARRHARAAGLSYRSD